jgi:hypothetical protein
MSSLEQKPKQNRRITHMIGKALKQQLVFTLVLLLAVWLLIGNDGFKHAFKCASMAAQKAGEDPNFEVDWPGSSSKYFDSIPECSDEEFRSRIRSRP